MLKRLTSPLAVENDGWPGFHAFAVLLIILYYVAGIVASSVWSNFNAAYGMAIAVAIAAPYFYRCRLSAGPELRLLALFTLIMIADRLLADDICSQKGRNVIMNAVLSCAVFPTGLLLSPEQRKKLLNWFTVLVGGFFALCAAALVFVVLTCAYIRVPPEMRWIAVNQYNGYVAPALFSTMHLGYSPWLFVALCLMIYQLFACKGRLWRMPIAISALLLYASLALCHSRTVQGAVTVSAGLLALLLGIRYLRIPKKLVLVPLLSIITAVAMLLCFKSFGAISSLASRVSERTMPAFAQSYQASDRQLDPSFFGIKSEGLEATENGGTNFSDHRDFVKSLSTFTDRTDVWSAGIELVKSQPSILLRGDGVNAYMDSVNAILKANNVDRADTMHNSFMEALMLGGLPGLLAVLVFTVLLVITMVRVFFSPRLPFQVKLLTLPVAGLLVCSLFEAILFSVASVTSLCFFLLAGMLPAYWRDLSA